MNLSEFEQLIISDLRSAVAFNRKGDHYNAEHYLSCARDAIASVEKLVEAYADDERNEEVTDFVYSGSFMSSHADTIATEEYLNEGPR